MDLLAATAETAAALQTCSASQQVVQRTLEANRHHQYNLNKYAERLTTQIAQLDKYLADAGLVDDDDDASSLPEPSKIVINGAKRAAGPISSIELLSPTYPFYKKSIHRMERISQLSASSLKPKEILAMEDAVKAERIRYNALNGNGSSSTVDIDADLNWDIIAEKVSDVSKAKRNALDCRTRWFGDILPNIDHSDWKADEVRRLKEIVASKEGTIDWVQVATELGTRRSPIDCLRHSLERRTAWTDELDDKLAKAVDLYGKDWNLVARKLEEGLTAQACEYRYERVVSNNMKRAGWTPEEDARLALAVAGYGDSWVEVAAAMPGRVNDQCRDRWKEIKPRPAPEGNWTEEEDAKLLEAFGKYGSQWKAISSEVGTRWTDKQCRKRHQTLIRRTNKATAAANAQTTRNAFVESGTPSLPVPTPVSRPRPRPTTATHPVKDTTDHHSESQPARNPRKRRRVEEEGSSTTATTSPRRTSSRLAGRHKGSTD